MSGGGAKDGTEDSASASVASMSRPDSQTPVRCSLRWVTASVNRSSCESTSLNPSRIWVKRLCCS